MGELIPLFPLGTPLFPGVVLPLQIFEPRYRRLVRDLLALPESGERRFFGVVAIRQGWEVERIAPVEALYDVGCTARVQIVRPQRDGGFQIVTVGGDRFRLLDVVVADDPPYLQAEVEWLSDEEAADEATGTAGMADGLVVPPATPSVRAAAPGPGDPPPDPATDLAADVARGSLAVLVRAVRGLFAQYVSEVAALQAGAGTGEDDVGTTAGPEAEIAELLTGVADDPEGLSYLVASVSVLTTEDRQALLAESSTRRRLATEARLLRRELTLLRTIGAVPAPTAQFGSPMTVN